MRAKSWIILATAFVLAPRAYAAKPPNIIFILADDMGRSDLSALYENFSPAGNAISAPNLEKMASEGMLFNQAYSGPVCAPSRTMFVTGRYNGNTTIRGNDGAFTPFREADRENNIPATLAKAGYSTTLIGKWGLGDYGTTGYPTNQSWTGFFGYDSQVACHDWYPSKLFSQESPVAFDENDKQCNFFSEDMFRNQTLSFLETQAKASAPFFLFLSYVTPHAGDCTHESSSHVEPAPYALPNAEPVYKNESWEQIYRDYASAITRQDRDTGIVLAKLDALGLTENTVVFFASDNGPEEQVYTFFNSTGPLRGYKRSVYEGGVRAPFIARWPGTVPANTTTETVVSFTDMLPTMADIAGLSESDLPPGTEGTSFKAALLSPAQLPRPPVYWEFCQRQGRFAYGNGWAQAVRMDDFKLIRNNYNYSAAARSEPQANITVELYNLAQDVGETTNLAGDSKYASQIAAMVKVMDDRHVEDVYWPSGPSCCDHQYGPEGPCTPANPPFPPHPFPTVPGRVVPDGYLD